MFFFFRITFLDLSRGIYIKMVGTESPRRLRVLGGGGGGGAGTPRRFGSPLQKSLSVARLHGLSPSQTIAKKLVRKYSLGSSRFVLYQWWRWFVRILGTVFCYIIYISGFQISQVCPEKDPARIRNTVKGISVQMRQLVKLVMCLTLHTKTKNLLISGKLAKLL